MKLTGYCHLMSAFRSATGCVRTAHLHGETPVPVTVRPRKLTGRLPVQQGCMAHCWRTIIWDTASRVVIPGGYEGSSKTGYASLNYRGDTVMPVQDTVTVGLPATVLWAEWRYSGTCQWSDTEPASGRYADSCPCTVHLIRALKTRRGVYRLEVCCTALCNRLS